MSHYLLEVVEKHFNQVYLACYNRPAKHAELESDFRKKKACLRLTSGHLKRILSDESWNFTNTWGMPTENQIDVLVDNIREDLKFVYDDSPVKNAEKFLFTAMVDTIKNIEIVSVCLAFLIPRKYCIIAPPPEHMIGFRRRSDKVATLLRYFNDFQALAEKCEMKVFDLEKALWTIHQMKYKIPDHDPQLTEQLWNKYLNDPDILRMRVKNLLDEIWGDNIDDGLKSKILKEKDPEVALILAMRYFEQSLWASVSRKVDNNKLKEIISSAKKGNILYKLMIEVDADPYMIKKAQRIWKKRNDAMHGMRDSKSSFISTTDVNDAIELNDMV
jgi:uncharacterized protein Usg